MATRYESGNREQVMRYMAECAIRDRESFISAWTPSSRQMSIDAVRVIEEAEAEIRDFKKMAKLSP